MDNNILLALARIHTEVARGARSGTWGVCRMARRLKSGWGSDRYGWFGLSGDTESEVHGVCVGGVIMYGRRMQACGVVRVSAEARMADACRRREASVHVPEARGERPRKVEWEAAANSPEVEWRVRAW